MTLPGAVKWQYMRIALMRERNKLSPQFQQYLDAYETEHLPARNYASDTLEICTAAVRFLVISRIHTGKYA